MNLWGRLAKIWRMLKIRWWSWRFRRHCASAGDDISVLGPCAVSSEGRIEVGEGLTIRSRKHNVVEISCARDARLSFGKNVFLNQGVRIACSQEISIGDNALIGDETVILDSDYHGVANRPVKAGPIRIESDVWLGTRVIVLRGVTIGQGSVVGSGAVVTCSVPRFTFAAGVPAQVIKSLPPQEA
jgi:maltose O-acetyltransferase